MTDQKADAGAPPVLEYGGHRVRLLPSDAIPPLLPTLPPKRMTWEVRDADSSDMLFGYIDESDPDEVVAFDPVAFEFGVGTECVSVEDAVRLLVDFVFPPSA
jgi:hypothetical protein